MRGIVYASQACAAFDAVSLRALEAQVVTRNTALGITGYLYFERGRFVHYFEGEPAAVAGLMQRIERDPRHQIQHVLADDALADRRFAAFTMRTPRDDCASLESLVYGHLLFMKHARLLASPAIWRLIDDVAALRGGAAER